MLACVKKKTGENWIYLTGYLQPGISPHHSHGHLCITTRELTEYNRAIQERSDVLGPSREGGCRIVLVLITLYAWGWWGGGFQITFSRVGVKPSAALTRLNPMPQRFPKILTHAKWRGCHISPTCNGLNNPINCSKALFGLSYLEASLQRGPCQAIKQ